MPLKSLNLAEVLAQFTSKQKVFVLVFILGTISLTTIITTHLTSECSDLVASNEALVADLEKVKKSIAECQAYNETLIHNNLLIMEKTNELHLKLLGNSNILQNKSAGPISDTLIYGNLRTVEYIQSDTLSDEEKTDRLLHDIMDIAQSTSKK
jgi:hypothetical protein